MNKSSKIYIAGHRGLVGSAMVRKLRQHGYENLVTRTHAELDLACGKRVDDFFGDAMPEFVFLAAARVGGIHANNTFRVDFLLENLRIQNNVISSAFKHGVTRLIFLGSSCMYPKSCPQPIKESHLLTGPLEYTNEPYALAKITGLKLCESFNLQYGTQYLTLMPSNLYGPGDNYHLENSHVLPALIKKCIIARLLAQNESSGAMEIAGFTEESQFRQFLVKHQISGQYITIWGTGKPRREFLHSDDLAEAALFIMEQMSITDIFKHLSPHCHINIGFGSDISIRELAEEVKNIIEFPGEIRFDPRKPDGTYQKLLDSSKINTLGWSPRIDLTEGIRRTINEAFPNIH